MLSGEHPLCTMYLYTYCMYILSVAYMDHMISILSGYPIWSGRHPEGIPEGFIDYPKDCTNPVMVYGLSYITLNTVAHAWLTQTYICILVYRDMACGQWAMVIRIDIETEIEIDSKISFSFNKKLQQTTKNTFGPGTHFPDDPSIRI